MLSPGERLLVPKLEATLRVERRRERRMPAHESVYIHIRNLFLEGTLAVRTLDWSTDGLSIRIGRSVPPGVLVQVRVKDAVVLRDVRNCVGADGTLRIGNRIESSIPLS